VSTRPDAQGRDGWPRWLQDRAKAYEPNGVPERSLPCPRATKVVHGASARDIEEPALLGGGLRTAGVGDRHKSVLEPGHEHDPPLESLCSVEGHDVDGVADLSGGSARRLASSQETNPAVLALES